MLMNINSVYFNGRKQVFQTWNKSPILFTESIIALSSNGKTQPSEC